MLDELIDRAWSCFNRMDKKPPDKTAGEEPSRSPMSLDASALPDRQRLESEFKQLLEELDLSPEKQQELNEQSAEKKWLMIVEQHVRQDKIKSSIHVESVVRRLRDWADFFPDKYTLPLAVQQIEVLAVALRTESLPFVQSFIDQDGINLLTRILAETRNGADCLALPILTCFKALLNSATARTFVLETSNSLLSVVGALEAKNPRCQVGTRKKLLALEILAGLCLVPEGGHYAVLKSLTDATTILGERTRFQKLVDELHREHGTQRDTERIRTAVMSLINALLKSGPAEQSLEFRLHLRYELLMLGIQEVIDGVRSTHGQALEDHLDLFEMLRQEDEQELSSRSTSGSSSPINLESPVAMVEGLVSKLENSIAMPHFMSTLQHMLMITPNERHVHLWRLFDLIVQQLTLQVQMENVGEIGNEVDSAFAGQELRIDFDRLFAKLRSEDECSRLEKELMEKDKKIIELENRLSDLQDGLSLSSFSRSSDLSSQPSDPCCHSPTPTISSTSSLPPVKPPSSLPLPPPPPPSAAQLRSLGGPILNPTAPKKKVPKPNGQVKSLNWTAIPHTKIEGTVWENIDDEKLYDHLDLEDLSNNFASTKDPVDPGTLQRRAIRTETIPSVLEFRRAQNCTIMLSKLKLSHREIRNAVLSMDEKGKLPKDMLDQMLKFIPTKDELSALDSTLAKHKSPSVLPLADRFLYEVGQIPRYEQRLKCLNIIRSFQERIDGLKPFFASVIKASSALSGSGRFTIRSLNGIHDVKSALKADRTLLHYVVELIEEKFPDLLKLKKELGFIFDATKFTRAETEQELNDIQAALRFVSREYGDHVQLQQQKRLGEHLPSTSEDGASDSGVEIVQNSEAKTSIKKSDKFAPVVKSFLNAANKQMAELERQYEEMKSKYAKCASFFAEDPTATPADEFFRLFTKFLGQFADCYALILKEREEVEREKRQTMSRTLLLRKCGRKQRESGPQMFDLLVNELQRGELFRDDLSRLSQKYPWQSKKKQQKMTAVQIPA
ncbi:hypothetical protein M3Y98_00053500 [Aphelenchoides besseyi]|nr:hypothetical protein M3Y98_00053500 [Aphelenchoides besseyi]KAI6198915.1 hypothetical protein M3Y96_00571100 [Aphelenchoides besseyi]